MNYVFYGILAVFGLSIARLIIAKHNSGWRF